jgi:hypothetical protein
VVGAPVLGAIIRAQDAASLGQCGALMQELRSVHSALLAMTASIERMHERCLPTVCVARAHSHARPRSRLSRSLGIVQVQQASCERIRIRASQPAAATARALLFPARHDVGSSIDGPVPRACMLQHSATLSPNQRAPCNRGLWPRRAAQVFYERIRPFLAGSRGSELLPQGVIFQGVGPAGATPHKLHGGSAAQSPLPQVGGTRRQRVATCGVRATRNDLRDRSASSHAGHSAQSSAFACCMLIVAKFARLESPSL